MGKVIVLVDREKVRREQEKQWLTELLTMDFSSLGKHIMSFVSNTDQRIWVLKGLNLLAACALIKHWYSEQDCSNYEIAPDLLIYALQFTLSKNSWGATKLFALGVNWHGMLSSGEKLLFWQDSTLSSKALMTKSALNAGNMLEMGVELTLDTIEWALKR